MTQHQPPEDYPQQRSSGSVIERHIQTIVTAVLLAVLLWTGNTLLDVREKLARIEQRQVSDSDQWLRVWRAIEDSNQRLRRLELSDHQSEPRSSGR